MRQGLQKSSSATGFRRTWVPALLLVLTLAGPPLSAREREKKTPKPDQLKEERKREDVPRPRPGTTPTETKPTANRAANIVEVQCIDGSTLKLTVLDERIELNTPYGKLLIPVRDIERIEAAFRLPDDVARRIDTAITDLGKTDFHRREAASAELRELGERAYPALLKAAKSPDAEVVHRARELLDKIRDEVPQERLQFRSHDVVYTAESKNTGLIAAATIKVRTSQFGEQQLRLADVRELRSPSATAQEIVNALPDPGNLNGYQGQIGKVHTFRVTGNAGGGHVWGTDTYTLDSNLATAAVHAGLLKPGQTGTVRVKVLGPLGAYAGSVRNGVNSMGYGMFPGSFEFVRGRSGSDR
jgi:hypothetical protein